MKDHTLSTKVRRTSLTLTRKVGEILLIQPDIEVEISEVRGPVVKVTVRSSADVEILRGELVNRKKTV